MPDWQMTDGWGNADGLIYYRPLHYSFALVYEDKVKFLTDDLIIAAAEPNFMELLSNKLHTAEQGYKKAAGSRR